MKLNLTHKSKSIIITFVCAFSALALAAEPCYSQWLGQFTEAEHEYATNVGRCEGSAAYILFQPFANSACLWEADYRYDSQIDMAAAQYERCLRFRH